MPRRAALLAGSRYELLVKIATGGTATVYVGRVTGSVGFSRLVAIKRAHPHLRDDATARVALIREATLAARVHHANVVPIRDVEETADELLLVMDYIEGGALSDLLEHAPMPTPVALRILLDAVAGLAAVHALTDETGRDVGMIHRDVSPQNILVGVDGTARLTDFGLARLTEVSASATATVKGKIAYMAPEYIEGAAPSRCCDVFSMGVVAWEALAGQRLFRGTNDADTLRRVVSQEVPAVSAVADIPAAFDAVLFRALAKDPARRFPSIAAFDAALSEVAQRVGVASSGAVGELVRSRVGRTLARRRDTVRMMADPDNATGSMLLDELPPLPRQPIEPTVRLADVPAIEEPDEETLRTEPKRGAVQDPARSWIFVAPALAALALAAVVVVWVQKQKAAPRYWQHDERSAQPLTATFLPPPARAVPAPPPPSTSAAAPPPPPTPRAQPTLPDNPYQKHR